MSKLQLLKVDLQDWFGVISDEKFRQLKARNVLRSLFLKILELLGDDNKQNLPWHCC